MAEKKQTVIIKKKISGHHGGHHGGAWKVAYADFVTAMMCFFLVMWLMGADEETKAAIAHYFNHPNTPWRQGGDPKSSSVHPMGEREGAGESIMQGQEGMVPEDLVSQMQPVSRQEREHQELGELVNEILDGQAFAMEITIEYLRFSVPEPVFFKPRTPQLSAVAPKYLDRLGQLFRGFKGQITIQAHTDDTPAAKGGFANPYEFSLARAVSVMNYLVEKRWVDEERLFPIGSGAKRGIASNDTSEGRSKNRRLEFVLTRNTKK
jgi:chemotaxis protein MotB